MATVTQVGGTEFLEDWSRLHHRHLALFGHAIQLAVNAQRGTAVIPPQTLCPDIFAGRQFDADDDPLVAPLKQMIAINNGSWHIREHFIASPLDNGSPLLVANFRIDRHLPNAVASPLPAGCNQQPATINRRGDRPFRKVFRLPI